MDTLCPICHSALKSDERLVMEFFPPRNWWVLRHERNVSDEFMSEEPDENGWPERVIKSKGWCARANVLVDAHLTGIATALRGTEQLGFLG